ncbi:hypothetical protein LSPH24S_06185 [Lysinibacillus sphaericus]
MSDKQRKNYFFLLINVVKVYFIWQRCDCTDMVVIEIEVYRWGIGKNVMFKEQNMHFKKRNDECCYFYKHSSLFHYWCFCWNATMKSRSASQVSNGTALYVDARQPPTER